MPSADFEYFVVYFKNPCIVVVDFVAGVFQHFYKKNLAYSPYLGVISDFFDDGRIEVLVIEVDPAAGLVAAGFVPVEQLDQIRFMQDQQVVPDGLVVQADIF